MATKPPILRRGDTIGIVTLGSPLDAAVIDAGIDQLESLGYRVVLGSSVYASTGFLAGTDQGRAEDLMSMFRNPAVRLILPTRGGVGVAGILPYLDYAYIASHPKIISGYSDITVLQNALYKLSNLVSFQSLLLLNFASPMSAYNLNQFYSAVASTRSPRTIVNPRGMPLRSLVGGNVSGTIIGGNLTSLVDTLGTPYEIDTQGAILLLEETHEPINRVYRMYNHLKLAGKFNDCLGIVTGQCTECTAAYGVTYRDVINEVLVPLGKPLLSNLSTAHGTFKAAIPIGARVNLDADNAALTVLEPTVSA